MLQVEGISSHEVNIQGRTRLLLGEDNLARLQNARVLIFGVGGVGSWCAEALVRSGIGCLTLVDADVVCDTNCNRQLMATSLTIGQAKVEALRSRLLEINPQAKVEALQKIYNADSAASFKMEEYDFVIDAIDSLSQKADLILRATSLPKTVTFISSMGAALRTDPFKIRQAEFWDIKGDPLARAIRKKFKHLSVRPARKFQCVYSEEPPRQNLGECSEAVLCQQPSEFRPGESADPQLPAKAQINGSLCHITAIFGMSIAGMVINSIIGSARQSSKCSQAE